MIAMQGRQVYMEMNRSHCIERWKLGSRTILYVITTFLEAPEKERRREGRAE